MHITRSLRRRFALFALIGLSSCVRERTARAQTDPARTAHDSGSASTSVIATNTAAPDADLMDAATPAASLESTIDAVRKEDWQSAFTLWQACDPAARQTREGRYLGGRIAALVNEHALAATLLDGLEKDVPALTTDILRLRGTELSKAGQAREARAVFDDLAQRTHAAKDKALAAEQAEQQGDHAAALRVVQDWLETPPAGFDRTRAWLLAAKVFEASAQPANAALAFKRVIVDEPDADAINIARAALTRLGGQLSTAELLRRAETLNDRARYATVIAELEPITTLQDHDETRRLHLLGRAYYGARGRYLDANSTLAKAAARDDNTEKNEDAFLSARSLARADKDDDAIVAFDAVASSVQGTWGDEAAFRAAWLHLHHERLNEAITRFQSFVHDRTSANAKLRTEAAWELGWALYNAHRYTEAAEALQRSADSAEKAMEKGRGRYWAAQAWLNARDLPRATALWQRIISERPMTWYAMLSELRLREHGVEVKPPAPPAARRPAPTLTLPSAVQFLTTLGFAREAGAWIAAREDTLRKQVPAERADEAIALAYMEMGEEYRAYQISQRHGDDLDHEPTEATRWVWDCSYPRPHAHWIEAAEDLNHMPRHYLFAIMRQESAFNPRDVSNARAIGLLQMIPPTTRRVARDLNIAFQEDMLFDPQFNIRVGGHYIGKLYAQYHAVLPRSIGSYNAGPGAMSGWVARWGNEPTDVFVERIPYDETRTYVRRVIQNLARYQYLYGGADTAPTPTPPLILSSDAGVTTIVDY